MPNDEIEEAFANMFALQFTDVFNAYSSIALETNKTAQSIKYAAFFSGIWTLTLKRTDERISANKHGLIAGRKISYADIYLSTMLDYPLSPNTGRTREEFLSIYPNIKIVDTKVRSLPRIAKWVLNRPQTDI